MILRIAVFLFVAYVDYALGRSDLRIRPALTAVTVLVAMILHGLVQLALPHAAIEQIAGLVALSSRSPTLVVVALVETAGIWLPLMLIRWASAQTRIWTAAYVMGAATVGAFVFYEAFEGRRVLHPEYEAWLVWALILATVPFAIGRMVNRAQRTVASPRR